MKKLNLSKVTGYIEENIGVFHQKRINSLEGLKLNRVLLKKNPYLFRTKNLITPEQIVRGIVDAHLSSNEETIFGDWLEGLAIFINQQIYGGWKSGIGGVDLEFDKDQTRYIVNIKSGPNWGNSSQQRKMITDFNSAIKTLRTSNSRLHVMAINGCCYGKDNNPDKGTYFKYCGQMFWEFISNDKELYTKIIEPLGHKAKEKNDEFYKLYSKVITKFSNEFFINFCTEDMIDWTKLLRFNSSAK